MIISFNNKPTIVLKETKRKYGDILYECIINNKNIKIYYIKKEDRFLDAKEYLPFVIEEISLEIYENTNKYMKDLLIQFQK